LQVAETGIPSTLSIPVGGHTRIDPSKLIDIGILCVYG
jgi:hypothetical protein